MPRSVENSASPPAEGSRAGSVPTGGTAGSAVATRSRLAPPRIRPMELPDVVDVAALEARAFPDPWSADSFLSELERRPEIGYPIVARDASGELVAYAVVWFLVDEAHIGNIAVAPEQQGRGVGSFVLRHILDEARRRDMTFATLEVRPSNGPALRLYGRFGFRCVSVRRHYYRNDREDAHVLALDLAGSGAPAVD